MSDADNRLRLVYRSYGGENTKNRPAYYSKLLTLASFARAASQVPNAQVIFLNDGPVPVDRLTVMERFGEVQQINARPAGLRASYRYALTLPDRAGWSDDDVVSFNEDDYLFTELSFVKLWEAAQQLGKASYFTVYGEHPDYSDPGVRKHFSLPRDWFPQPSRQLGDSVWFNLPSTTSTFAARVGALRADQMIFRQCMIPFRRRFLDHETCLIYQGQVPYHGAELVIGLPDDFVPSARGLVRTLFLVPFRAALNVRAMLQREAHYLYALTPNEATHLENPVVSGDRDWVDVAATVATWAEEHDLPEVSQHIRTSLVEPMR